MVKPSERAHVLSHIGHELFIDGAEVVKTGTRMTLTTFEGVLSRATSAIMAHSGPKADTPKNSVNRFTE